MASGGFPREAVIFKKIVNPVTMQLKFRFLAFSSYPS